MKQTVKRMATLLLALLLTLTMIVSAAVAAAQSGAFAEKAYTDLVTFSDCQSFGPAAFNNFGKVLRVMHDDGLPEPDALLVGGDYSRLLNDTPTRSSPRRATTIRAFRRFIRPACMIWAPIAFI